MDFVKNQITRIQQQLSGLTASQRMLTGALVVIMVMTLLYWGRYAGTAEMEPLLEQPFAQADIAQITSQLKGKGIPYDVQGDRIVVAADRKWEALADLAFTRKLPQNNVAGFDEMIGKLSPFATPSERDAVYNRAREGMCAQIISRFPGVDHAAVMITKDDRRMIGAQNSPVATVEIATSNGQQADEKLVEAAASVVAGAQAGLMLSKINVVVNGVHVRTSNGADGNALATIGGNELLKLTQQHEEYRARQIRNVLGYIQGVLVSVVVDPNPSAINKEERLVDPKPSSALIKTRTQETETTSGSEAEIDPGAGANTGADIAKAGGTGQSSKQSDTEEAFDVDRSITSVKTVTPGGNAKVLSATVRVPRSYFTAVLSGKSKDGKAATPDDAAVDAMIDIERPKITKAVMRATGLVDEKDVSVEAYADAVPMMAMGDEASVPKTASVPVMIGNHGKEIALGGLALVSLFLLMMTVRKSSPAPVIASTPAAPSPPPQLVAGDPIAGEAGDGNPLLDGMELDEDAVRTQQMLDQVTTMVSDNPDGAAALVKRWLNRD